MAGIQAWLTVALIIILLAIVIIERRKIKLQKLLFPLLYIVIYRSNTGIRLMDKIAKAFPRFLRLLAFLSVVVGFLGMAFISYALFNNTLQLFLKPEAAPGVQPVLPINVKGVFFVPFIYWIIAIFLIAVVHEFAHGITARLYDMKVKSSGFLFISLLIPLIPAAFVEPDEKKVVKRPALQQYAMFASGAFSNLVFAGLILLVLIYPISPIAEKIFQIDGVKVVKLTEKGPADLAGLKEGEIIKMVNDIKVKTIEDFTNFLSKAEPGDEITITTDKSAYTFLLHTNPENPKKPFVGISTTDNLVVSKGFTARYGKITADLFLWFISLMNWLFMLNIGIGLFNLAPLSVLDGGRMFRLAMQKIFTKQNGDRIWHLVSMVFVLMIVVNLVFGFLK